jgi:hypothetical protein
MGDGMSDWSENNVTLGELVRSVSSLVAQVAKLSDKLDEHRDDLVHRFDGLGDHYVRKDIHIRDIAEVHARQDNYQRQTDVLITDVEDELRAQSKAAADASAQRHQDRITLVGIAVAAVVAVVVAFIPVLFP